jgi:pyruvate-formate lyase-activating enzyme
MKYDMIKHYKDEEFRRLTGVKRATFKKMISVLRQAERRKKLQEASLINYLWKIGC